MIPENVFFSSYPSTGTAVPDPELASISTNSAYRGAGSAHSWDTAQQVSKEKERGFAW